MPTLVNPRHEMFATLVASGVTAGEAYRSAGFRGRGAAQSGCRLARRADVADRIRELNNAASAMAVERLGIDREYVLRRLQENAERAMQARPVLDGKGRPTGVYRYEGAVANRALELLGRELGMFAVRPEPQFEWDGDPSKLTDEQLEKAIASYERRVFGNDQAAIAQARAEAVAELDSDSIQ